MTYEKAWNILETQALEFFLKLQKEELGKVDKTTVRDFIRNKFEIEEFDNDVIIFTDEYGQLYNHDIE